MFVPSNGRGLLLSLAAFPLVYSLIFLPTLAQTGPTPTPTSTPTATAVPTATSTPTPVPTEAPQPSLERTPVFRHPVVEGAEEAGLFDHDQTRGSVVFYDGRTSQGGFFFACPAVGGATVGCSEPAADEAVCPDQAEMWYDNHKGVDYEYAADWRTGDSCDRERFAGLTAPVYAPAAGRVSYVGWGKYNGNFVILNHDLNGDGDYSNDGLRSYYLHFADDGIAVYQGQIVAEGDLLGTGGMTGLSWTPHLHFEVQRYIDGAWRSVDPFGWYGDGDDPWPYLNYPLWREDAP